MDRPRRPVVTVHVVPSKMGAERVHRRLSCLGSEFPQNHVNSYAQSKHNERAYDLIRSRTPDYLDWEVTATFYAALHIIEKRLQDLGETACDHRRRMAAVKRLLPKLHDPYSDLYMMSLSARYAGAGAVDAQMVRNARRAYEQLKSRL